jgi:SAM-dependent methyltransferase
MHRADVTHGADVAPFRESFDVITCNDVIEHVRDPKVAIEHIAAMLRPGGLAYFEIPNRDEVSSVMADGHYQLFGITQLDRELAFRYFETHSPGVPYGVEHYLELAEYRALFEQAGLTMELRTDPVMVRSLESVKALLAELRSTLPSKLAAVPSVIRERVEQAVSSYLDQAEAEWPSSPSAAPSYLDRYGTSFWRVIARKRPPGAGPKPDAAMRATPS